LQRQYFRQRFKLEGHSIIVIDGKDAGRLSLDVSPERVYIAQINLLPQFQRKGIGTAIIESVKADAAQANKPVELRVLRTNPDARRLYERLGFTVFDETETHIWMRWNQG